VSGSDVGKVVAERDGSGGRVSFQATAAGLDHGVHEYGAGSLSFRRCFRISSCFRENTLSACGRARLEPNVVFESGQFATILAMVAANTGVSVVPQMAVEVREGCRFIPIR
jgi:DNA-binding transcriptional LysR family regulator